MLLLSSFRLIRLVTCVTGAGAFVEFVSSFNMVPSKVKPPSPVAIQEFEAAPVAVVAGPADGVTLRIDVPGGWIGWYAHRGVFEAHCTVHEHCVLTRQNRARFVDSLGVSRGGRPLGFFMCWLQYAHLNVISREEHWSTDQWRTFSFENRSAQRLVLTALEDGLLRHERPRDIEKELSLEPDSLKGYL